MDHDTIDPCDLCHGFLIDFLCFPIESPLTQYVKTKNIPKVSHELAKEFYRIFKSINELEYYYIIRKLAFSENVLKPSQPFISDHYARGMVKLEGLIDLPYKENVKHIIFILEENNITMNKDIQVLWIAYCIEHIWIHLGNIHNEHSKKRPATCCGPPIGIGENKKVDVLEDLYDDIAILYD